MANCGQNQEKLMSNQLDPHCPPFTDASRATDLALTSEVRPSVDGYIVLDQASDWFRSPEPKSLKGRWVPHDGDPGDCAAAIVMTIEKNVHADDPEPTMEDVLASIREVISDEDAPQPHRRAASN